MEKALFANEIVKACQQLVGLLKLTDLDPELIEEDIHTINLIVKDIVNELVK